MIKILFSFLLFSATQLSAQIEGQWHGLLKVPGLEMALVINVTKTADGYSATMDSPDQKVAGIPVTSVSFAKPTFSFSIANARIEYEGVLGENQIIKGTFKQAGQPIPMDLSRNKTAKTVLNRPQEPKGPFAYISEDVQFTNSQDQITLAGTLTFPDKTGKFPAVILISGSGPQNRDSEIFGHKSFLLLADLLTKNGIAVLRYDDRGTAKSTGNFTSATSADFAQDVQAAMDYLKTRKEIDGKKIGLLGHSEGGMIAPMVAANNKEVAFIVLVAGPGLRGSEVLLLQQQLIGKAYGATKEELDQTQLTNEAMYKIINSAANLPDAESKLSTYLKNANSELSPEMIQTQIDPITSPWMFGFLRHDPVPYLQKVKCPVLAIGGSSDLQVPSKENLAGIKSALLKGGNTTFTIKEFPNLNHLMQTSTSGSPNDYGTIEETFAPQALEEIKSWILTQVK